VRTGGMDVPVCFTLQCTVANRCPLGVFQFGQWHWHSLTEALVLLSQKLYTRCILAHSALVYHVVSFHCYHYLAIRNDVKL
jgi:hypothetical protein